MNLDSSKAIRIKIMDFLSRREHTKKELLTKMKNRVDSLDMLLNEIKKLESEGLINEQRYAEEYIRSRVIRGYGPIRIESELRNKGLDNVIINEGLSNAGDIWVDNAIKVLSKKFHFNQIDISDQKILLKMKRFLAYRGFNFDQINKAIKHLDSYQSN